FCPTQLSPLNRHQNILVTNFLCLSKDNPPSFSSPLPPSPLFFLFLSLSLNSWECNYRVLTVFPAFLRRAVIMCDYCLFVSLRSLEHSCCILTVFFLFLKRGKQSCVITASLGESLSVSLSLFGSLCLCLRLSLSLSLSEQLRMQLSCFDCFSHRL